MQTKNRSSELLATLLMFGAILELSARQLAKRIVIGPNLNRDNKDALPWSARFEDMTGNENVPIQAGIAALKDVDVIASDAIEDRFQCSNRVIGTRCELSEFPKNAVLVKFVPSIYSQGGFTHNGQNVKLSHLMFLPNGQTLGVVKS